MSVTLNDYGKTVRKSPDALRTLTFENTQVYAYGISVGQQAGNRPALDRGAGFGRASPDLC